MTPAAEPDIAIAGPAARPGSATSLSAAARVAAVAAAVVAVTAAAAALETAVGVADASEVYLLAVVLAASLLGTPGAVVTSLASFLVYDFLFTSPRFTLEVSDPAEWLSLLLFLVVAVAVGRLTGMLRERADEADRRVREGVALVAMSRDVALAASFQEAAGAIAQRLLGDAEMASVQVTLAEDDRASVARAGSLSAAEALDAADAPTAGAPSARASSAGAVPAPGAAPGPGAASGPGAAAPGAATVAPWTLVRSALDGTTDWLRLHPGAEPVATADEDAPDHYLVDIVVDGAPIGAIETTRPAGAPRPGRGARRLLVLAADQLGIAARRDRLRAELTAAEVARQGDALRAAILDAVSHDLRTPVASVRALAGGLAEAATDPNVATVRRTADAIDGQAQRLGSLLNGLLDMGRIQAGAVRPDRQLYDLAELVETTLRAHPPAGGSLRVEVDIPDDLPTVMADAVLFDVALGNVLDNAAAHASPGTRVRVAAQALGRARIALDVDDDGPGVPPEALEHLFDRFYRAGDGGSRAGGPTGSGLGLAVARGFVEAMGGTISAEASPLGGLGIRIRLPGVSAEPPA